MESSCHQSLGVILRGEEYALPAQRLGTGRSLNNTPPPSPPSEYSYSAATTAPESPLHPPEAPAQEAQQKRGLAAADCIHCWWKIAQVILPPKEKEMEAMAQKW
ncbi:hypothetical protein E2C01_006853 [Portunus trituberculatus]|uniref:Uncharacterized protein n=1 Tax=Portunus trituberculatus TaxID=210409 RepID=A0A5B7CXE7_PORTR|nr:hypothetical protein [Portunus trituberculatus]